EQTDFAKEDKIIFSDSMDDFIDFLNNYNDGFSGYRGYTADEIKFALGMDLEINWFTQLYQTKGTVEKLGNFARWVASKLGIVTKNKSKYGVSGRYVGRATRYQNSFEKEKVSAKYQLDSFKRSFGIMSKQNRYKVSDVSGIDMYNIITEVPDKTKEEYEILMSDKMQRRDQLKWLFNNFTEATDLGRKGNGGRQEGLYVDLQGYEGEIIVIGDVHANLPKLIQKIEANREKLESGEAIIVFEGDYVHREHVDKLGEMYSSVMTLFYIMNLKIAYPQSVYLLAGNHDIGSIISSKNGIPQGVLFYEFLSTYYDGYSFDLHDTENVVTLYEQTISRNLALVAEADNHIIVHAGPITAKSIKKLGYEKNTFNWRNYLKREKEIQSFKNSEDYDKPQAEMMWIRDFTNRQIQLFAGLKVLVHGHSRTGKEVEQNIEFENGERKTKVSKRNNFYEDIAQNNVAVIDSGTGNGYGIIDQRRNFARGGNTSNVGYIGNKKIQNLAKRLGFDNPQNFRFTPLGAAIGVILETFVFFKFFDTRNGLSFENQHENMTFGQRIVVWVIRAIAIGVGIHVFSLFTVPAVILSPLATVLTAAILHYIHNIIKISFGKYKYVLQTSGTTTDKQ
ncbi:MAG: metallophosphoesterase, partial [Elusimicrobia bacterium]|nr:metallophosphoesterase [Elusimicrobiota bacterium]